MKVSAWIISLLAMALISACSTNPVTGKQELSLISEAQELSIGQQQYAPMRQSQGGDYAVDPQVVAYVNEVGQRLAAVSDRKLPYEFKVLNNSVPNAWALPGGKIAINRGLLTELGSEAELAAVLGHEIVHAAAKHSAQGMQRGMLLQGLVMAASIAAEGRSYANAAEIGASVGAQLINQRYGRDAERESDKYGMLYMSRAGYDPQGAVDLQKTFVKLSKDKRQDWLSGLFSSHPPSQERVQNNISMAASLPKGGIIGKERYQKMIARLKKSEPAYDKYEQAQKALSKGNTAQAKQLVAQAIAIEPAEGHFYSLLGDIERNNKRYNDAYNQYNKAIRHNDDFFYYYLQRGLVSSQLNNNSNAVSDLQKSVALLPTANAYKALGDIASAEQRYADAKQYYARAADSDSDAGKAAYSSLVKLDLAGNPGKYIQVRAGLDRSGRAVAEIANTTGHVIGGITLAVRYMDNSGRIQQVNRVLQGELRPGQKALVNLDINVHRATAGNMQAVASSARIVR